MTGSASVDLAYRFPHRQLTDSEGGIIRLRWGVIRWEPNPDSTQGRSRPYLYCNSAHPAAGIKAVRCDWGSGRLVVTADTSFAPIGSMDAAPDETFAQFDVIAGASVGPEASFQLVRAGVPIRADHPDLGGSAYAYANLWLHAVSFSVPAGLAPLAD